MPEPRDVPPTAVAGASADQPSARARVPLVLLRGVQFGVDLGLSSLLAMAPLLLLPLLPRNPDGTLGSLAVTVPLIGLMLCLSVALSWAYWAWWAARRGGRTLAMGWLRLRVVGDHGQRAGTGTMTLRWMGLLIDGILFGAVGLALMLLTPREQRFGDLLASTTVVRDAIGQAGPPDSSTTT